MLKHYMSRIHFVTKSETPETSETRTQCAGKQILANKKHNKKSWSPGLIATGSFHLHANLQSHATRAGSRWGPSEMKRQDMAHQSPVAKKLCFPNPDYPRLHWCSRHQNQYSPYGHLMSSAYFVPPEDRASKNESCGTLCSHLILPLMQ
jgi:hypothetical protein